MSVDILLRSLYIEDKMVDNGAAFHRLVTSDDQHGDKARDLVRIKYFRVQPNSPEFMTVHEGVNQVRPARAFRHSLTWLSERRSRVGDNQCHSDESEHRESLILRTGRI
jgi:hypothetical protein